MLNPTALTYWYAFCDVANCPDDRDWHVAGGEDSLFMPYHCGFLENTADSEESVLKYVLRESLLNFFLLCYEASR
jgi:hypothetical protein